MVPKFILMIVEIKPHLFPNSHIYSRIQETAKKVTGYNSCSRAATNRHAAISQPSRDIVIHLQK